VIRQPAGTDIASNSEKPTPRLTRRSSADVARNTITATTVAELSELVGLIGAGSGPQRRSVRQRQPGFHLAHYDLETDPGRTEALGVGPTGLSAWIDVLVRLAHARVSSIASRQINNLREKCLLSV